MNGSLCSFVVHVLEEIQKTVESFQLDETKNEAHWLSAKRRLQAVDEFRTTFDFFFGVSQEKHLMNEENEMRLKSVFDEINGKAVIAQICNSQLIKQALIIHQLPLVTFTRKNGTP